jgi:hypothetical protein
VDGELSSLTVVEAPSDKRTGSTWEASSKVMSGWQTALEDAIGQSTIFTGDHNKRFSLRVSILRFSGPMFASDVTIDVEARYDLVDENTGKAVYSRSTHTIGFEPFEDSHFGVIRARDAANLAVQNNIADFLADLQKILLASPIL